MPALPEASYSELRLCSPYHHERRSPWSIIGLNRKADDAIGGLPASQSLSTRVAISFGQLCLVINIGYFEAFHDANDWTPFCGMKQALLTTFVKRQPSTSL